MNERVGKLRDQSLKATPRIDTERARIVTEVAQSFGLESAPMKRALTFKALLEQKTICIN